MAEKKGKWVQVKDKKIVSIFYAEPSEMEKSIYGSELMFLEGDPKIGDEYDPQKETEKEKNVKRRKK